MIDLDTVIDQSARDGDEGCTRAGALLTGFLPILVSLGGLWAQLNGHRAAQEHQALLAQTFRVETATISIALVVGTVFLLVGLGLDVGRILRGHFSSQDRRRVRRLSWMALRILFVGLGLYLFLLQPFHKPTFDVMLALSLGLWAAYALVLRRPPAIPAPRVLRALDLVLFNLCLAALLAEGVLRIAARVSPSPLLAQESVRAAELVRAKAEQQRPGTLRFGFPFNAQGHYDTDFASEPTSGWRIASIGDSFSVGVVPHHFHFTTVIERQLDQAGADANVENVGYPGIGPFEYLHLLRSDVLPRKPDLVVVNLFIGNDLGEAKRFKIEHRTLRLWLDRDNLLLYNFPRRLARLRKAQRANVDASGDGIQRVGSVANEATEQPLTTPEAMVAAYPWLADPDLEEPSFRLPGVYLHIEAERAEKACDPGATDIDALVASLGEMRRLAGDTPLVVTLLPDDFQVDDDLWRDIVKHTGRTELVRDLPQQLLTPWLNAEGIPHLDLLPILRERCNRRHGVDHRGSSHCYHLWDSHFNAHGNRVVGEAMAQFVAPLLGIGSSHRVRERDAGVP